MPTPFPGMDPYLEQSGLWKQVHADLIVHIRQYLVPVLQPNYYVAIEQYTQLSILPPNDRSTGIPDVAVVISPPRGGNGQPTATMTLAQPVVKYKPLVAELPWVEKVINRYLEIRDSKSHEVVTAIEILSPVNKMSGRTEYQRKRLKILASETHLIEIDLLRSGEPPDMKIAATNDYRIIVSRSGLRPNADVYLFSVRDPIPEFPIPLRPSEAEPELPLNEILHKLYDLSGYAMMIDYLQPPKPALSQVEDAAWARELIAAHVS